MRKKKAKPPPFNPSDETLIRIADLPNFLKDQWGMVRVSRATTYRWISGGLRGCILETILIGATRFTSEEALERWSDNLTITDRVF